MWVKLFCRFLNWWTFSVQASDPSSIALVCTSTTACWDSALGEEIIWCIEYRLEIFIAMVPILLLLPCLSLGYQDCRPLNRNDDIGPFPLVCDLWISVCQKGFAQEETPSRTTLAPEDELRDPKQFAILKGQVGLNWQDFWALMYFQFSPSHFYHFCQSNLCSGSWPRLRWNWRSYCGGVVCWGKRGRRWKLQI